MSARSNADALRTLAACALLSAPVGAGVPTANPGPVPPDADGDRAAVAALDVLYQAAVKRNDVETMASILHERFVLVLGDGSTYGREDLLDDARARRFEFERQDEDPGTQTVRVYGDTAVVTARLWLRYTADGRTQERRLWFSDTYVRTAAGWKYAFGQASLPLPDGVR